MIGEELKIDRSQVSAGKRKGVCAVQRGEQELRDRSSDVKVGMSGGNIHLGSIPWHESGKCERVTQEAVNLRFYSIAHFSAQSQ